jgi:uncharacterized repeat protein (TIGR03943 family)
MARDIPVYLFTGFLEGGKTHIIQESMESDRFNTGEKTLIIQCEEGIDELDPTRFTSPNCYLEVIEEESDINEANLLAIQQKHKIDRIIIEYNGMWKLETLYANMPRNWVIFQQMLFVDASTFLTYNANMRSLMVDKLMDCEMVVFNRTPDNVDKEEYHKIVRGISRRAAIAYEYPDGHVEYDEIEDPLPFDIDSPIIEIKDEDYALWYRDLSEEMDRYKGKTVRVKGLVATDSRLNGNAVIVGRHIMTCCADDIAYSGLVCYFDQPTGLETRDWITVTAKIKLVEHKLYGGRLGPVLYAESWERAMVPEQEVATFY